MKRISRITLTTLVMMAFILAPACKTTKKVVDQPAVATDTAPPPVVAPPPEPVPEPTDFVAKEPEPVEVVPTEIEALNKWAQDKGYIRDAFYNYDEATLDDAAQAALTSSATWLKSKDGAGYNLLIEGHCDERGTEQYNLALGDRRANSAKEYLATLGVDAGRIRTVSYGEERPFADGHDESSWSKNRRAHLVLVR